MPPPTSSASSSAAAPRWRSKASPSRPYNPAFFPPGFMRLLLLLLAFSAAAHAAAPPPPAITGRTWIVGDLSSGQVLASRRADERIEPASLTKLMTAYLVFAALRDKKLTITQPNRNRLLWLDSSVDGVKTGHTDAAGYCLIASSKRGPRRLLSVLLGGASENGRAQDSLKLLNWGFQFFDGVRLYAAGQPV